MSTTLAGMVDVGKPSRMYPELIALLEDRLAEGLRRQAREAGLDVSTETNLTRPDPVHFAFTDDDGVVEVPEKDSAFTRFFVEATYEESK